MNIKTELLQITSEQLQALSPFLATLLGSLVVILLTTIHSSVMRWWSYAAALITMLLGIFFSYEFLDVAAPLVLFNNMLVLDKFSYFFSMLFCITGLITIMISDIYLDSEDMQHPEFNVLVIFSVLGMQLLVASADLVVLFIALEIMSLAVYSLVAFRRNDRLSNEAGLKYFILGGAASAVFLYGVALTYGVTGTTRLSDLLKVATQTGELPTLFTVGSWLMVAGFLFKMASVPFHMWMPDVYEGAPAPVTGFMTTGLKAAVFATFLRLITQLGFGKPEFTVFQGQIYHLIWISAVLTMAVGNLVALSQNNLKRIFAYSSIAHTGYLLVGIIAALKSKEVMGSVVLYLISYIVMNLGAFGILTMLSKRGDTGLNIHDISGLAQKRPLLAAVLSVFLFSMAGIPPTAGFIAKYSLFYAAVQNGEVSLVIISVLCSAISVYYYLRIIVYMYMRNPAGDFVGGRLPWGALVAVGAAVLVTLQMGLLPDFVVQSASKVFI